MASVLSQGPSWLKGHYSSNEHAVPDYDDKDLDSFADTATEAPASAVDEQERQQKGAPMMSLQGLLRGASYFPITCLGFSALVAGLMAVLGALLLIFVGFTSYAAPAYLETVRPLYFDYTQKAAMAQTSLLGTGPEYTSELPDTGAVALAKGMPTTRTLPRAQPVQMWVELRVPDSAYQDLLQVTAELMTSEQRVVARSTRTWVPRQRHPLVKLARGLLNLPLVLVNLYDDSLLVKLLLFDQYLDKPKFPAVLFRAHLSSRYGSVLAPQVYQAELHVRLHLGWRQAMLYHLRPSPLWAVALAACGLALCLGGAAGLAAALLLMKFALPRSGGEGDEALPGELELSPMASEHRSEALSEAGTDEEDERSDARAFGAAGGWRRSSGMGKSPAGAVPSSSLPGDTDDERDVRGEAGEGEGGWERVDAASILSNDEAEREETVYAGGASSSAAAGGRGAAAAAPAGAGSAVQKRRGFSFFA